MDVSCPQCDTLYEFDARQVRPGGVTLKCSQCEHLFRLEAPAGVLDESHRRWMIRKQGSGDVLYFSGFDALHRWIMDGSVGAGDAISRTGRTWTALESIGEFTPVFQVVASIASLSKGADAGDRRTSTMPRAAASGTQPEVETVVEGLPRPGRRPGRSSQGTVPGLPGLQESAPTRISGEKRRTTSPEIPSQTAKRERAQTLMAPPNASVDIGPVDAPGPEPALQADGEWSLGELDLSNEGYENRAIPAARSRSRRWPVLLIVLLVSAAALGIWQWERLELFFAATNRAAPVAETAMDEASSPVGDAIRHSDYALSEARDALEDQWDPRVAEALASVEVTIGEAVQEAAESAQRAARPSVAELIAGGRRALDRGNGAAARERFQRALDEESSNVEALIGLGWAYLALGDIDAAVGRFNSALVRDSSNGEALIGMGRAERERGDRRAALAAYEDYLQRFPGGSHASIARFQSEQLRRALGD